VVHGNTFGFSLVIADQPVAQNWKRNSLNVSYVWRESTMREGMTLSPDH
jgi:hypothetical protein